MMTLFLSIEYRIIESKKNVLFFQNFKIYVAMQNGCYGDFAPILECRTRYVKCG